MKLQLDDVRVAHFATICGPTTGDLSSDTTRVLAAFRDNKHDPCTRKDVTAVLLAMGEENDIHLSQEKWSTIGSVMKAETKRVVRRGYYSQFSVDNVPAAETKPKKAPKKNPWKAPDEPTLTSKWFEAQIRDKRLDRKVAALLKRRFTHEEYEDLLSEVRLWFVRWSNKGTCDKFIAKGKPPTLTILTVWLEGKMTHRLYKEGQDALLRENKGVRTQGEIRMSRETGKDWVREDALQPDPHAPEAIWVLEDEGRTRDFVSPTVEEEAPLFEEAELAVARDIVRARRMKAGERYARIFDHMVVDRKSKRDAAMIEGVSELRITHLYQRVRDDLKKGPSLLQVAMKVLKVIAEEPFSTVEEIENDLPTDEVPCTKDLQKALVFLKLRGLAQEAKGDCFAPTDLGHKTVETGSFV